MEINIKNK